MSKFNDIMCAASVDALQDGSPIRRVQLLPMGDIKLRDGRGPFRLKDKAHAEAVIAATQAFAGKMDLMVDYDHQSVFGAKDGVGGRAPAAAWIKASTLTVEADGIYGDVEWTEAAAAALKAREYRYISPLFGTNKAGDVTRLINAGLTNTPAIDQLAAVAAATNQGADMALKDIALALGLSETASEADIIASIGTVKGTAASVAAISAALDLQPTATSEQIIAAATAAKAAGNPDPSKFAPLSVVTELQGQVKSLTEGAATKNAETAVAAAMKAGKVTPTMKDWALDYAKKDLAAFEGFVAAAAVVVAPGAEDRGDPKTDVTTLTEEEKRVAASLDLTEEQMLASKKQGL